MQELNMERYGNPHGLSTGRAASSVEKERWPNAVIPYEFDCSIGKNALLTRAFSRRRIKTP
jgi:hypothetical protein